MNRNVYVRIEFPSTVFHIHACKLLFKCLHVDFVFNHIFKGLEIPLTRKAMTYGVYI